MQSMENEPKKWSCPRNFSKENFEKNIYIVEKTWKLSGRERQTNNGWRITQNWYGRILENKTTKTCSEDGRWEDGYVSINGRNVRRKEKKTGCREWSEDDRDSV